MMRNDFCSALKNKISYKKAIIVAIIALLIIFMFLNPVASTNTRSNSSLKNIDWGMTPEEVKYITSDYSRDGKFFENHNRSVLIQMERITESEIAAKSMVEYFFEDHALKNIKITKKIKYWPDYILDQLLKETVKNYEITAVSHALKDGHRYFSENPHETKLIYLGYDKSQKAEYAYVELTSKTTL